MIIEEDGHEGCGFYPEDIINENCDSLQVRIIAPTIGLAKGMLLKKRGITCIQIPRSMIKVPPSKTCSESWAAVVIKNVFPSEENRQMGRLLDPDANPPIKSWIEKKREPMSKMHQRMLIGFGVNQSYIKAYARPAKIPERRSVKNPTGMKEQLQQQKLKQKLKHGESKMLSICDCIVGVQINRLEINIWIL